jgi:hypothetical protein
MSGPLPISPGGEPIASDIAKDLRRAIGTLASEGDTLEDAIRRAEAELIADEDADIERAVCQAFVHLATDALEGYERVLGITPPLEASEAERRETAAAAWTVRSRANIPSLVESLQGISPAFSVAYPTESITTAVRLGRTMGDRNDENVYGPYRQASGFPNYSTRQIVRVRYQLAVGETVVPEQVRMRATELLNARLPAFVDWTISTGSGFYCNGGADGSSRIGYKAL